MQRNALLALLVLAIFVPGTTLVANPKTAKTPKKTTQQKATPAKTKKTKKAKVPTDMVQLDFTDVEIKEVVKAISKMTKRSFVFDDSLRGKITIISPKPISVSDAYQVFISALEMKGYATVPKGKLIKIVPLREIQSQAIPFGSN